jgi:methanethiol S-methyltransferase
VKRTLIVSYSVVAYAGFLAVVLWAIAFLADLHIVTAVDRGARDRRLGAVVIDVPLFGAFAVHHSVMAREGVGRRSFEPGAGSAADRATPDRRAGVPGEGGGPIR